jgi:nitroreductase
MSWDLDDQAFAEVVGAATRAPSMHNSQPWRFRRTAAAIDLLLDTDRRLPVSDQTGWAVRLACGAALFNLRLALAARGTPALVRVLPEPEDPTLVARLAPDRPRPATRDETRLHAAIPRRRSNRFPFRDQPVPVDARARLIQAARDEGAWLDLLPGPAAVDAAAGLARTADEILNARPEYRAELAAWTRWGEPYADGVPVSVGGPAPRPYDLLARRDFGGESLPPSEDYEREPLIGVLGAFGDWPADQVQAGQALQRVLLVATDIGLASSMISQPIEVPAVREQLRIALGRRGSPQMLLRFGYATPVPPSARRPVDEVVIANEHPVGS